MTLQKGPTELKALLGHFHCFNSIEQVTTEAAQPDYINFFYL